MHVYFDYISPYAYFGWRNVRDLARTRSLELSPMPVVFGALLHHYGHLGPAEIAPKREWTFRSVARYAALHEVPLRGPATHPFRSLTALRASLVPEDPAEMLRVIDALFDAIWAEGIDGGDDEAIAAALTSRGFDGATLVAATREERIKDQLKATTSQAIDAGVFGVPTFVVDGELFWGNDSLADVERVLDGNDPLDKSLAAEILARPAGVHRPR